MSNSTVIADVGYTLVKLLRDSLSDLTPPESIVLLSPAETVGQNVRLTLSLYFISENQLLKNQEMHQITPTTSQYPPLSMELYYLLTTYASPQIPDLTERTMEEHRIMGKAMSVLYDNAVLRGSVLQGVLSGSNHELRLVLNQISLTDLYGIWQAIPNKQFKSSVSYIVSPVYIESSRIVDTKRVVSRDLRYSRIEGKNDTR